MIRGVGRVAPGAAAAGVAVGGMAAAAAERQLVVAVEGTAALGPYWPVTVADYVEKIVR